MTPRRRHEGYAVAALILTYCAHWLDMSFAGKVAPAIAATFNQSLDAMTYVFSGSRLGMALGGIVGGFAGDRWGRKPVLCLCLGGASMLALVTPAAGNFWLFVALRTLSGVLLGGAAPCALAMVANVAPPSWRPLAITATLAGISLGSALGSLMVYLMSDPGEWLLSIPFCGVVLAASLLLVAWWVPGDHLTTGSHRITNRWHSVAGLRATTWILGLGFALTVGLNTILVSWQSTYFHHFAGASLQQFAGFVVFTAPAGILGMLITGSLLQRIPYAVWVVVVFGGHAIVLACLGWTDYGSTAFIAALAAASAGQAAGQAILNLTLIERYPAELRGTVLGMAEAVARLSGVIAPVFGAMALHMNFSLQVLYLVFAVVPATVGMMLWALDSRCARQRRL